MKKTDYDFAGRNSLRLICWEMDILKRLPGECGSPVCMPATWKMSRKSFFGKDIHCISAKKKNILRYILVGCSRFLATSRFTVCGSEPNFVLLYVVRSPISFYCMWFRAVSRCAISGWSRKFVLLVSGKAVFLLI